MTIRQTTRQSVPSIASIPTVYKGVRFRSRTEARWAVFFDALQVAWEFEPQAYIVEGKGYLPDFWLPSLGAFWEVKGVDAYDDEKIGALVDATGCKVFVAVGAPSPENPVEFIDGWAFEEGVNGSPTRFLIGDIEQRWCACPTCGSLGVQFSGRAERNPCQCFNPAIDEVYGQDAVVIQEAYRAARDHRFWEPTGDVR